MSVHSINNHDIFVDQFGDGVPVLALHGLGGSSNFWWPLHAALPNGLKIIAPDMPSSGRSANDPALSISSLATDMLSLMDALGLEQAHLLSHSMGTIVCQHMAVNAPGRILSLALLGPLAEPPEPARPNIASRAELARTQGMQPISDAIIGAALAEKTKMEKPVTTAFVRELVAAQDAEGYALSCLALAEAQATDVTQLTCPTLLITGDEDKVAPPANVDALGANFGSTISPTVLEDCGHWTLLEQPQLTIKHLKSFYGA